MSLEVLTGDKYLDSLVPTNPVGATDPKSQGDDHIRGIKNVLQKTFPNINAPVTATPAQLNMLTGRTYFEFATGAVVTLPFFQAAAPTGWTQNTAHTDKALRVVSTTGGGTGGTHGISSPPSILHTHTIASHYHSSPIHFHTMDTHEHQWYNYNGTSGTDQSYSSSGVANNLTHQDSSGGLHIEVTTNEWGMAADAYTKAVDPGDTNVNSAANTGGTSLTTDSASLTAFAPKYVDIILCSKN